MKNILNYFLTLGLVSVISTMTGCVNLDPTIDTTRFYVLKVDHRNQPDISGTQVLVRNVDLADYLENSQIAQRSGPNTISYLSKHRWAGSLDKMIAQIVAEEISRNITGISATASVSGNEELFLDISILQFDFVPGLTTNLILEYSVINTDSHTQKNRGIITNRVQLPADASIEQTVSLMEKTLREGLKGLSLGL